jgi:hypothetical protein
VVRRISQSRNGPGIKCSLSNHCTCNSLSWIMGMLTRLSGSPRSLRKWRYSCGQLLRKPFLPKKICLEGNGKETPRATTGKWHSFIGFFIFIGFETDEYKVIFVSLGWTLTNIWAVRFDFDWPHIFIGRSTSLMNIIHVYSSVMWLHRQIYVE